MCNSLWTRGLRSMALAGLVAAVGCGGTEEEGDAGVPPDTTTNDTAEDVEADTADVEDDDADAPEDTEPLPECTPGLARCASGVEAVETCGDDGFWAAAIDCPIGEICFEGACAVPGVCEPYEVEACDGCNRYRGCNAAGTATGTFDVPFTKTCQTVDGEDALIDRTCLPNQQRCISERVLERCDECGLGFDFATDCREDDETTVCDVDRCTPLCEFIQKRKSYIGCEYWAVDLDNAFVPAGGGQFTDADGQPFAVVVSNPNEELVATVTVTMRDGEVARVEVQPGDLEVISLHFYANEFDTVGQPLSSIEGTMIGFEGFRVESNVPIIAYQFNPLDNEQVYSNDASLLFPTSSLGTEYLVMTRRQTFDTLRGYLTVVATQPGDTEVTVTLPPRTLENPLETLSGVDVVRRTAIPRMQGGETYTVTLEQFMVLNIETDRPGADLTGAEVRSSRPVAVFGGAEAANAPNDDSCVYRATQDDWVCEATRLTASPRPCVNGDGEPDITLCSDFITCCADHIEHQMLPLFAWGRRFNAVRSARRGDEPDVWRVLAGRDGVEVELVGLPDTWFLPDLIPRRAQRTFTLDRGEFFEFLSPVDFEIRATGPIQVGQFLTAEFAPYPQSIASQKPPHVDAGTGDPAFILGVPVEQYRSDYTVLCPAGYEFDYLAITAPAEAEVRLNGEVIDEELWEEFGTAGFRAARILVEDGVHRVTADLPIGVMVHGYDSFVSYGYAGGLDIAEISVR